MAANLTSQRRTHGEFGNEDKISTFIQGLGVLTEASSTKESLCKGQSEHLIENVLQQNLISLQCWMTDVKSKPLHESETFASLTKILAEIRDEYKINIRHLFSSACIILLNHLTDLLDSNNSKLRKSSQHNYESNEASIENAENENINICPVLSVQQTKQISTCIQFVLVLGLCPYITQGIGIPISERLGPGQILLATSEDTVANLSESKRVQNLLPVLNLLVKMTNCVNLQDLVTEKYLSDVFIVLIQVRHSAKIIFQELKNLDSCNKSIESFVRNVESTRMSNKQEENMKDKAFQDCDNRLSIEMIETIIQECNVELDRTIRNTAIPIVLRETLSLLGFVKSSQSSKGVPWFRRIMAGILRDVIMNPPGLHILLTLFLGDLSSYDTKDWQNCKAVARIISHCPVNVKILDKFYSSVTQQLLEIIHPRESSVPLIITKTVGAAIFELNCLQSEQMHHVCFSSLTAPLADCSLENVALSAKLSGTVIVDEKTLNTCISHCHRLFVIGQETQSPLSIKLDPVLGVLFSTYVQIRRSASFLKGLVKDLLTICLNFHDTRNSVVYLMELILPSSKTTGSFPPVHPDVCFLSGDDGGVEAIIQKDQEIDIESWTQPASAVVDLLKPIKSDDLNSQLFIALLEHLTSIVMTETNAVADVLLPARALSQDVKDARLKELKKKVMLVSLISEMGEDFGSGVIQNTSHILSFTKATLDRCVAMCALSDDKDTRMFEWETVTMSLGLLSAVLGIGCVFTDEDKKKLDSILPLLSSLAQSEVVNSHIRDMASDLKVSVATRGLVSVSISAQSKPQCEMDEKQTKLDDKLGKNSSKPFIEILSSQLTKEENDSKLKNSLSDDEDAWSVAMREVKETQIPVKGHGLIQLSRMVEDREEGAIQRSSLLLRIFLENLNNSDSYIYLASVNGLAALSDLCHEEVIPSLTSEFGLKCKDNQCSWETTVKVGEAIVKATRRLGEMAPKYRDVLLSALLIGCHHDNSLVKASCLSGLADVCKLLRYSISPVIQEVLMCCRSILTSEPDADPRRAAALTLSSLLQGLGKDILTVLGEEMKELYRTLKQAVQADPDEKVQVQAQLALEELDGIMKIFLFPSQDLKKSIKILGYQ